MQIQIQTQIHIKLSDLSIAHLRTPQGAPTIIEKSNHRLCIALNIYSQDFPEEISALHGFSKESSAGTPLGVKSLSQKLFAFRRSLRNVGQQDWKFLEVRLKKALTSCATFLPNQLPAKATIQLSLLKGTELSPP